MRRAARVDANQRAIVKALRAVGATVEHLHQLGQGTPDLLVGYRQKTFILEVKTATGQLTEDQKLWHRIWQGLPVAVVCSAEQAFKAIGAAVSPGEVTAPHVTKFVNNGET